MATIPELLQSCLAEFASLISSTLSDHIEEVPLQEWRDELGRLRVWATNIGAHQTRQSSLDYRLRDASHIRSQVVRLLVRVRELLTDLAEVLEEKCEESQDNVFEDLEDISEGEHSVTEVQQIHQGLFETITQLYQMSMIIREPSQHDRLVGTDKLDAEPFQFWAKQHISNKYPDADSLVVDRISSAMARQRAILKYRERHHLKLSQGIDYEGDGKSTVLSETVATDFFGEIPGQFNDIVSDAGGSETSYGTLLEGGGAEAPKIPPMPQNGAEQRPFECPYCFYIIVVRDKRAWARHIFRDLMPYVCIFAGCPTPNKLYDGRRQWYHHIRQTHISASITDSVHDCSICKQASLTAVTFQHHVGQHLEELALFLLPRTRSDEDENAVADEEKGDGSIIDIPSEAPLDGFQADQRLEQRGKTAASASDSPSDGNSLSPFDGLALPRSTGSKRRDEGASQDSGGATLDSDNSGDPENKPMTLTLNGLTIAFTEESIAAAPEPEPVPEPEPEPKAPETTDGDDWGWGVSRKKDKKKQKNAIVEESVPEEPAPQPEERKSINIRADNISDRGMPHQDRTGDSYSGYIVKPERNPPDFSSPGTAQFKTPATRPAYVEEFDEATHDVPGSRQVASTTGQLESPIVVESNEMASEVEVSGSAWKMFWYCCGCSFGPHNEDLHAVCIDCGKCRCSKCPAARLFFESRSHV